MDFCFSRVPTDLSKENSRKILKKVRILKNLPYFFMYHTLIFNTSFGEKKLGENISNRFNAIKI